MKILTVLFLLCFPFLCSSTERKPWFGNEYEAEFRASLLYQNYDSINRNSHHFRRHANDLFAALSVSFPFKRYCGEFEVTEADTHHQNGRWDNFRLTGRYQWLDYVYGDPLTLVTGITITEPYSRALHDISSFHHGHIEGEFFLSFGEKYGYGASKHYYFRWWNVIGVGTAEKGSAWVRGDAAAEYNYHDMHYFRVFVETLWGMGKKRLHPRFFRGYGKIAHQSIDLGVRYSLNLYCFGTLSFQYARRIYALNFPEKTNLFFVEYYLPFGSQVYTNY